MKKIALTSLLAMFAVSAANAANVINGNPLYKPAEGHFASITSLGTSMFNDSDSIKNWGLNEDFAYGVTDNLSAYVYTGLSEVDGFDPFSWDSLGAGIDYRLFNIDGWVLDLGGFYTANNLLKTGDFDYHFDKDRTSYSWSYGFQTGYMSDCFTIAGTVYFGYNSDESFNWGDKESGFHNIRLGLDGQYVFSDWFNMTAGIAYIGQLDDHYYSHDFEYDLPKNRGQWSATLGANFNIDETKFIGVYATTGLHHENYESSYKLNKSMGLGVKFGIDF